jgi:hypothetical protein
MAPKKQPKKQARKQPAKSATKRLAARPSMKQDAAAASLAREFMAELDAELRVTRRCVERVPSDKGPWKPHPSSANIPKGVDLNLASDVRYSFEQTSTLLGVFDANEQKLRASLAAAKPEDWSKTWRVLVGEQVLSTASRKDAMRNTINHLIHHRGQLTVYLRMNEAKIPQLYGPSGDERG